MKRTCSMGNLHEISKFDVSSHVHFKKPLSVDQIDKSEPNKIEPLTHSLSLLSLNALNAEFLSLRVAECNGVEHAVVVKLRNIYKRIALSLSALNKDFKAAESLDRKALSCDHSIYSALQGFRFSSKPKSHSEFGTCLSSVGRDTSFERSESHLNSAQESSLQYASLGSEFGETSIESLSDNEQQIQNGDSNMIETSAPFYSDDNDRGTADSHLLHTAVGVALNLAARIVGRDSSTIKVSENSAVESVKVLSRSYEINEKPIANSDSKNTVRNAVISEKSSPSMYMQSNGLQSFDTLVPSLSSSSRELSVISENFDEQCESESVYERRRGTRSFIEADKSTRSDVQNFNERGVDVDEILMHQRSFSDGRGEISQARSVSNKGVKKTKSSYDVTMRHSSSRNGEFLNRCKSQVMIEPEADIPFSSSFIGDHSKKFSSSSPSVNEQSNSLSQIDILNSRKSKRNLNNIDKKQSRDWKDSMPMTLGAHQVFAPVHKAPRLVPVNGDVSPVVVRDTFRNSKTERKGRVDKKHTRKSSTLLDFFRKPELRGLSDVVTPIIDRRSMISDRGMGDDSTDFLAKPLKEKSNTVGVSGGRFLAAQLNKGGLKFIPEINKAKWSDLDLWSEEPLSWSSHHGHLKMSKKECKKQDIINEFYITEKHHCQVLVVLQQVYQEGLNFRKLLNEEKRELLIPQVLDALVDFHINFLRKLRQRRMEADVVHSISDIICNEFEKSDRKQAAVHAYTEFCSSYDSCGRRYDEWTAKNPDLKKFFDEYAQDPMYKKRTFKMCLLLIGQRPTKYPVLLEKLSEVDNSAEKENSQRAFHAAKRFVMHINNEIAKYELNNRWDRICSQIDQHSKGRLGQNNFFTYDDLILTGSTEVRRVICIGGAICQNSQKKSEDKTEILLALFDDILVLLTNPGSRSDKYLFHDRGSGISVIPLTKLIVRDVPRSTKLFFLVADDPCYDLFVVSFASKSDVQQWKHAIESAKEFGCSQVKRAADTVKLSCVEGEDPEERRLSAEVAKWEEKMRELFEKRIRDEQDLSMYIEKRLAWFESLRLHLKKFPITDRTDGNKSVMAEKIKGLLKQKFSDLRAARKSSLCKVLERAERIYEDDFVSYFDDNYDASATTSDSNHSTDQSESDDGRPKLPRRNRTFNGIGEHRRGNSVRRHTTEPKIDEGGNFNDEVREAFCEEEIRKLPLKLGRMARRAAIHMIRENATLRVENNRLHSEIAFREIRIASLKSRRSAATPANALEALRKRQQQLQTDKVSFQSLYESQIEEIDCAKADLLKKESELKAREDQLQLQWEAFYELKTLEHTGAPQRSISAAPLPCRASPSLSVLDRSCSVRSTNTPILMKSTSGSSIPLHLAEKSAKVQRSKK